MPYFFHTRRPAGNDPGGITVSKREQLPAGDVELDEFRWGRVSLWFVVSDKFTKRERQNTYEQSQ